MNAITKFWQSANASNVLGVLVFILVIAWWDARGSAKNAEEYAEATKNVIVSNNDAGLEALIRQREQDAHIIDYKKRLESDEINREFLDTPIPDEYR